MSDQSWLAGTFAGLRVLDLSSNLAGPLAAMVLGDLGADVVKIERAGRGDDTRSLHPSWEGTGTVFLSVNRGKRSVELDLASDAGREAVLKLAETADVLVESFGPGVAEKLGLDFEAVRARSPRIVYCTVSAFGPGPIGQSLPGYDSLIQGFSGMMSITGHEGAAPVRVAPSAIDLSTGLWLTLGTMAALQQRERDGEARHLDVALVDSAFNLMGHQLMGLAATGVVPGPLSSGSPSTMPNGAFQAADGWIVVATGNQVQWERLCGALGTEELLQDPRFATVAERIAARAELQEILASRFIEDGVDAWITRLQAVRVPVGRLHDLAQALEHPLVTERALLVSPDPDGNEQLAQLRLPIDPSGAGVRKPPPRLGQHTEEVLREAGFDDDAIRAATGSATRPNR